MKRMEENIFNRRKNQNMIVDLVMSGMVVNW